MHDRRGRAAGPPRSGASRCPNRPGAIASRRCTRSSACVGSPGHTGRRRRRWQRRRPGRSQSWRSTSRRRSSRPAVAFSSRTSPSGPCGGSRRRCSSRPIPIEAARRAVGELCSDPTAELLAEALSCNALPARRRSSWRARPTLFARHSGSLPAAVVRVVGTSPGLGGEVRGFARLVEEASGWEFDEAREAVNGAAVVLLEALAAGPRGRADRRGGDAARPGCSSGAHPGLGGGGRRPGAERPVARRDAAPGRDRGRADRAGRARRGSPGRRVSRTRARPSPAQAARRPPSSSFAPDEVRTRQPA